MTHKPLSPSPKKKHKILNASPSHLIRKYGHKKIQLLEQYLNDALQQSIRSQDFHEIISLKDKLTILQLEAQKHTEYIKNKIIKYLVGAMEEETVEILKEFERESEGDIANLQFKFRQIQEQFVQIQEEEFQEQMHKFDEKQQGLHPTSTILRLKDQLQKLLAIQDYVSAARVKNQLQKQQYIHLQKKGAQIKKQKTTLIHKLQNKHKKQQNAMKMRFQAIMMEQLRFKQRQLSELLSHLKRNIEKIEKQLYNSQQCGKIIQNIINKLRNGPQYSIKWQKQFEEPTRVPTSLNTRRKIKNQTHPVSHNPDR